MFHVEQKVSVMPYKLLFIDIDGTLVGNDFAISKKNKNAISLAIKNDINVILCSGRSYASLRFFVDELSLIKPNNFAVSFNGCVIHDTYKNIQIHDAKIPICLANNIFSILSKFDVDPVAYWDIFGIYAKTNGKYADAYLNFCGAQPTFVSDFSEITHNSIYKIIALGEHNVLKNIEKHFIEINSPYFNMFFSGHNYFEFCSSSASKGIALNFLCKKLNINPIDTIAIGDSDNDISMLSSAGVGVAMQNSSSHVKTFANYITSNNCYNDGVAEVIEKFIL